MSHLSRRRPWSTATHTPESGESFLGFWVAIIHNHLKKNVRFPVELTVVFLESLTDRMGQNFQTENCLYLKHSVVMIKSLEVWIPFQQQRLERINTVLIENNKLKFLFLLVINYYLVFFIDDGKIPNTDYNFM